MPFSSVSKAETFALAAQCSQGVRLGEVQQKQHDFLFKMRKDGMTLLSLLLSAISLYTHMHTHTQTQQQPLPAVCHLAVWTEDGAGKKVYCIQLLYFKMP